MLSVAAVGPELVRRLGTQDAGVSLPPARIGDEELPPRDALGAWTERYRRAAAVDDEAGVRGVGREMLAWLDQGRALAAWLAGPELVFELRIDPAAPGALDDALLGAPWEVLCRSEAFLAEDDRPFVVARRCGASGPPVEVEHRDLSLMFMAAAPRGRHELDYEAEEAAILQATRPRTTRAALVHLQVEESGALEFLSERLRHDGPFEALHLSCHGDILAERTTGGRREGPVRPVLMLEDAAGGEDEVDPSRLIRELGQAPPLVFLSACRTAERGGATGLPGRKDHRDGSPGRDRPGGFSEVPVSWAGPGEVARRDAASDARRAAVVPDLAGPYVRRLAQQVPNVLGWDGSVYDGDATRFAEALYGALAGGEAVPLAAARARQAVLRSRAEHPQLGRHWHLARVYLGPGGGGPLVDRSKPGRPPRPSVEKALLGRDPNVPVARPEEFVGRRRQIQAVIRAFRAERPVLVHGMGNLGKSSLAARVAARMPYHQTAVVFRHCRAEAIMAALRDAAEAAADRIEDAEQARRLVRDVAAAEREVAEQLDMLRTELRRLLNGALREHPVLLVLDDFERSLEDPTPGGGPVVPQPTYRAPLVALFRAFAEGEGQSRLLITSRYDFALPDGTGADLAAPDALERVPLVPMGARERTKQWRAKARAEGREESMAGTGDADAAERAALIAEALAAAGGNPGLQDALTRPILAGEPEAARAAIEAIATFRAGGGTPPEVADLSEFFGRMAFERYEAALTGTERLSLGAAALFAEGVPVPRAALEAAAGARGVADPGPAVVRLLALGLLDDWGGRPGRQGMTPVPHVASNPLARTLGEAVEADEAPTLAAAALPELARAWRDHGGDFPLDPRAVEAARLGLLARPPAPALLDAAAQAAVIHLFNREHDARAAAVLGRAAAAA